MPKKFYIATAAIFASSCVTNTSRVSPRKLKLQQSVSQNESEFRFCSETGAWKCDEKSKKTPIDEMSSSDEKQNVTDEWKIAFEFDSAQIPESFDNQAIVIKNMTGEKKITIRAFTDDVGTEDYNRNLAKRRAESVVKKLVSIGMNREQIIVEEVPSCCNKRSRAERLSLRKAEIHIEKRS